MEIKIKIKRKVFPQINLNIILSIILLIGMWILFGFNTYNADFNTYRRIYSGYYPNHEWGFIWICNFFYHCGISFQHFRIILSFILIYIFYITLKSYSKDTFIILLLYFLFPFALDCVQLRTTIANIIILMAIRVLLSGKKGTKICFAMMVMLAASMHYFAYIFLILLLSPKKISRKNFLYLFSGAMFLLFVISYTDFFPKIVQVLFASTKVNETFMQRARLGVIIPIGIQITSFVLFYLSLLRCKNVNITYDGITGLRCQKYIYNINILMFILIPMYVFSANFFRVYRMIQILNNIFIIEVILRTGKWNGKSKYLYILSYIVFILFLSFYEIEGYLWKDLINNNLLF